MSEQVVRSAVITAEPAEALAALLDIDPPAGHEVPPMWHTCYLLEHPATRDLGPDGHATSGIPAPPGPGLRRMFAGGRVETRYLLHHGPATRTTRVVGRVAKQGRTGPLTFLTVRHEYAQDGRIAVVDENDLVYRGPSQSSLTSNGDEGLPSGREAHLALDVDEALLFRFSALTYNGHRIHYDRQWCRHEGYDDLVVHGPLQALMMGELLRRNGVDLLGRRLEYRLVSPMIGPQTMHVLASSEGVSAGAEVRTADGRRTAGSRVAPA
ncbi:mesaconyl-C4 CoA hydratase [Intrasporangium sp.]|uniref:mesaconyl-C4 CoA hydratase n=1 Tax=Intrasporangium sp. TaxID=1925024 RepID=UPI00322195AF